MAGTVENFHRAWHESEVWKQCWWRGHRALKCPMDMWIYQELIHKIQPSLIIETGTYEGGSSLFLADMCELVGRGRVVTIDIRQKPNLPKHPRLFYLHGSSVDPSILRAASRMRDTGPVMVILDSNHHAKHVLEELELYGQLVTVGSYVIVEDTDINETVRLDHGPGPAAAVREFLAGDKRFVVDLDCQKFGLTFNPGGYLKCVR